MIPKIIHYCWLSKDPYPEDIKACMNSWKKVLPDYEFKLWNFSCFNIESSKWVKEAFLAGKYAFAADYIRMYALYNYGGIYLDCDVEVLQSFNSLLHLPYFLGKEKIEEGISIEAATLGFEKGHPLLADLLEYYQSRRFYLGDNQFDIWALPAIILQCINQKYTLKEIQSIKDFNFDQNTICLLPTRFFSPKAWYNKELELKIYPDTYSIHHFAGSWLKHSNTNQFRFRLYRFLGLFFKKYRV